MKKQEAVLSVPWGYDRMEKLPFSRLADVVRDFFRYTDIEGHYREYSVLRFRFGLDSSPQLTLDEIGVILDVSKQRVGQLEQKVLVELGTFLREGRHEKRRLVASEPLETKLAELRASLKRNAFPLTEHGVYERVKRGFSAVNTSLPLLRLLLRAQGFREVDLLPGKKQETRLWVTDEEHDQRIIEATSCVFKSLCSLVLPAPFHAVKLSVNRQREPKDRFKDKELRKAIQLCPGIETVADSSFQVSFECLRNVQDKAYRILHEEGEPLGVRELTRMITKRTFEAGDPQPASAHYVGNRLSCDDRFVAIGRLQWALSEWDVDTRTIIKLMEAAFHTAGEPVSLGDIWDFVRASRTVERSSIIWYLTTGDRFVKLPSGLYTLPEWVSLKAAASSEIVDELRVSRESLARAATQAFHKLNVLEMPLTDLAKEVGKRIHLLTIGDPLCTRLERLPTLTVTRQLVGGRLRRIASISARSKKANAERASRRSRFTKRALIQNAVREILRKKKDLTMPMRELRKAVVLELSCPKASVYSAISDMDDVSKTANAETGYMECALQDAAQPFQAIVGSIEQTDIQFELRRALGLLHVDTVDLALFQLGKLFENTLRRYMLAVRREGRVPVSDKDLAKLSRMITWCGKAGIIRDETALHFLRIKRNERTHDEIPSLEERQALLANAPSMVRFYLDYIRLISNRLAGMDSSV